jgi:hypothetical protein
MATKIENIETPNRPEREPWLWHLAHQQFTLDEMASGYAFSSIQ